MFGIVVLRGSLVKASCGRSCGCGAGPAAAPCARCASVGFHTPRSPRSPPLPRLLFSLSCCPARNATCRT
eukprot:scaffold5390_cov116-Isochrysis_galbana.AAC.15